MSCSHYELMRAAASLVFICQTRQWRFYRGQTGLQDVRDPPLLAVSFRGSKQLLKTDQAEISLVDLKLFYLVGPMYIELMYYKHIKLDEFNIFALN